MKLTHVLMTTDLTATSEQAVPHAAAFATAFGAELSVLYCDPDLTPAAGTAPEAHPGQEASGPVVERIAAAFKARGLEPRFVVAHGAPQAAIGPWADLHHADLIVMATHARHWYEALFHTSTTSRVAHIAHVPVLAVPPPRSGITPTEPVRYRHILAPTDYTEASRRSVELAAALAERLEARLTVLNVRVISAPATDVAWVRRRGEASPPGDRRHLELERWLRALGINQCDLAVAADEDVGARIPRVADALEVDLIVMPPSGRHGIERVLLGNITARTLRRTHVPIYVTA